MEINFLEDIIKSNNKIYKKDKKVGIFKHNNIYMIEKYDIIVLIDLFSYHDDIHIIEEIIDDAFNYLNSDGKIIFIEKLKTDCKLNIISEIKNFLQPYFKFIKRDILLDDVYELLRKKELYILDTDRIYNVNNFFEEIQYFSIITFRRYI